MTKIGVLIPTRGDRPQFLAHAKHLLSQQSVQPDFVEIVDSPPKDSRPDITYRYRIGCEMLVAKGAELILFWEDDDWYGRNYISAMLSAWKQHNRPKLIGISSTIYYNIVTQKFVILNHPGRASMMSTGISAAALRGFKWCDDNYSFTDMHLWKSLGGVSLAFGLRIAVGIKHGLGLCGGGGHVLNWGHYNNQDRSYEFLSTLVDPESLNFYKTLFMREKFNYYKVRMKKDPFLTIVTRMMKDKRPAGVDKYMQSVRSLSSIDFEQVFIIDPIGQGMLAANTAFQYVKDRIDGEYVYLLDDDDFFTEKKFIEILKKKAAQENPDVIFFKMKILTGDGDQMYPKPQSWGSREPRRGQIGGSCFVVKKWVYEKYIHHFAQPSFGDWHFITEVLKDPKVKFSLIDIKMAETGKVSRGRPE